MNGKRVFHRPCARVLDVTAGKLRRNRSRTCPSVGRAYYTCGLIGLDGSLGYCGPSGTRCLSCVRHALCGRVVNSLGPSRCRAYCRCTMKLGTAGPFNGRAPRDAYYNNANSRGRAGCRRSTCFTGSRAL